MGILKDSVVDFAGSHYHSMPRTIREKVMEEGKKQLEKEDSYMSSVLSEQAKEKIVENYFSRKESERCKKKS